MATPTAPAGSGAQRNAESAKKAAADVNALVTQAKTLDTEGKKITTDAQAGKKLVEDARQKADAAAKTLPPVPQVPAPTGNDPDARYDSAIQITGNTRKVQADAETKTSDVREYGVPEEGPAAVDASLQAAKKQAAKLKELSGKGAEFAQNASASASAAAAAAAESKKKADQAAKENSADKAALATAAQQDAKHAQAAKDAASKAQAESKQLAALSQNADAQVQSIEKIKQETSAASDALNQQITSLGEKLVPYYDAVDKAEQQEAKAKEEATNPEAVLQKRYEALGGDPELSKALADEDKAFETATDQLRAHMKDWQKDRIRELDEYKKDLEEVLKGEETIQAPMKKWHDREAPLAEKAKADAQALGEKLKTEPGKEVMHEIDEHASLIAKTKHSIDFNEKVFEKVKAARDGLKSRYEDVDKQYEAYEKYARELRTELDNELQMANMSLDDKVNFLQTRPKPVRDRIQKKLESELNRLIKMSGLDTKAEQAEFEPPVEPLQIDPIDWTSIQQRIEKLKNSSLDELQKDDPKLAGIQEEYEKAGGDPALFDKRMAEWKQNVEAGEQADKKRGDEYRARSEKLRDRHSIENQNVKKLEDRCAALENDIAEKDARFKELQKKVDPMVFFKDFTPQERAEYQLLERELARLRKDLENQYAILGATRTSQKNAEKLIEQDRQRYEQVVDDDRRSLPKPTSEDIHKMPLRAKYTELTGKPVPA
jgi:hypothetical protein